VPFRSCLLCTVQYTVSFQLRRKLIVMQMSWGCTVKGGRIIMEHSRRHHAVKLHWHDIVWPYISMLLSQTHRDIKNLEPHVHTTKALKLSNLENRFRKWSRQDSRIQILIVCQKLMSSLNYYILGRETKLACYSLFSLLSPKSHLNRYLSLVASWEVGYWNSPRT
jgi:hypothetical protein